MEPRGTAALLKGRAWSALLMLGVALLKVQTAGDVAAQGSSNSAKQQYEAAMKAAQKAAQRHLQQQQQKRMQAAQPKAAVRAHRDTEGMPVSGRRGEGAEDDGADIAVAQAERRVREIEDVRRQAVLKAEQEQAAWRREQQARVRLASADKERSIRRLLPQMPAWARRDDQRPAEDAWRAEVSAVSSPDAADRRRVRWLEEFQRQASHLGMGRNMRPADGPAKADEDAPGDGVWETQAEAPQAGIAAGPAGRAAAVPADTPFPGQERGAEMPAELYGRARGEELVVSGLSPVDLETAKQHGFVASAPTLLGTGQQITRLRAPGASREEALRELHKVLPFLSATPNQAYTIYMGSLGETDVDTASGVRPVIERHKIIPATRGPCPRETCFGRELINWTRPLSACTRDVRIGIIDTSFDLSHPAFRHIRSEQASFLDGRPPSPYDWHGTAVLSLLAGDPESGTPGLAPDATFLLATAFRSDAAGNASTDTVRLLSALAWLDARGVDVVNMSFTGPQDPAFEQAIATMRRRGVVFVAAAGNMGPTAAPSYPAAYPDVIAVTAINRNGEGYRHANRGTYIDVSAPGVDILTALPGAQQGLRTGTSFAAPFVTAIAATRVGEPVPEEVALGGVASHLLRQVPVRDLGPPGPDPIYGAGLVMAPSACAPGRDTTVARAAPALESWAAQTMLIRAGALAP